jgi:hypothetical protein
VPLWRSEADGDLDAVGGVIEELEALQLRHLIQVSGAVGAGRLDHEHRRLMRGQIGVVRDLAADADTGLTVRQVAAHLMGVLDGGLCRVERDALCVDVGQELVVDRTGRCGRSPGEDPLGGFSTNSWEAFQERKLTAGRERR